MSHAPVPATSVARGQERVAHTTISEAKHALHQGIKDLVATAKYANSEALITMPSPNLMVRDIGVLGLPLSDIQAKQVAWKARQEQLDLGNQSEKD